MSETQNTSPENPNEKPTGKMRPGLRVLLVGSLALNLLVIGIIGGAALGQWRNGGAKFNLDRNATPLVHALSHKERREVGRAIRRSFGASGVGYRMDRESFTKIAEVLAADTLNADALKNILDAQVVSATTRFGIAQSAWLEKISAMSADERKAYAARLQEVLAKKGKRAKRDKD